MYHQPKFSFRRWRDLLPSELLLEYRRLYHQRKFSFTGGGIYVSSDPYQFGDSSGLLHLSGQRVTNRRVSTTVSSAQIQLTQTAAEYIVTPRRISKAVLSAKIQHPLAVEFFAKTTPRLLVIASSRKIQPVNTVEGYMANGTCLYYLMSPVRPSEILYLGTSFAERGLFQGGLCLPVYMMDFLSGMFIYERTNIVNCVIARNSASYGGGMSFLGMGISTEHEITPLPFPEVMVTNCTITGNSASSADGGIWSHYTLPIINSCIFWENLPEEFSSKLLKITNSDVQGRYPGIGNINADPLFVDPNAGDYHLKSSSPCIHRGKYRCEMGAYGHQMPRNWPSYRQRNIPALMSGKGGRSIE